MKSNSKFLDAEKVRQHPNMGAGPLEDKQELLTVGTSFQSLQAQGQRLKTSLLGETPVDQIETGHCIIFISVLR